MAISVARNLAIARTSEMSEKVPESSISLAEISGGVKSKIYNIYINLDEGSKKGRYFEGALVTLRASQPDQERVRVVI